MITGMSKIITACLLPRFIVGCAEIRHADRIAVAKNFKQVRAWSRYGWSMMKGYQVAWIP
jgi:hypothetical protein